MYKPINTNIEKIINFIKENDNYHITEYDWLIKNLENCESSEYYKRYKRYWRMHSARLSTRFCKLYFQSLKNTVVTNKVNLRDLIVDLYQIPTQKNNRHSLQISFSTKLFHMTNRHMPIYDSTIRDFYNAKKNTQRQPIEDRINYYMHFYIFLKYEYTSILLNGYLDSCIKIFRDTLNPQEFTDEKIIDSLIWGYMSLVKKEEVI